MPVEILIDENDTINAIVSVPQVSVEIIAKVVWERDTIRFEGLHLERLAGGPVDRRQIARLCAEVCAHFEVERVIIQGARRTTGRAAGSIPKTIEFRMPK